ncbi:hypothetical protein GCM10027036_08010 [Flavihumibacter cheonanensis]|uniref:MGH1-like glycoside hydrolase domain-containing protein n=1 Tax=Flavihumibacter cheonanensis TaxID=1442385 RepID=UPI001EF99EAE|nr:trehalase family glycosidase [Flavihumibacter cheonanensis]MCG7751758.1 hypothetical protein [Flavihumibacter cheonanensis]
MNQTKPLCLLVVALLLQFFVIAQPVNRKIVTPQYKELQQKLSSGWNTWYANSFLSHVLLPEGFSINLCLTQPGNQEYVRNFYKAADIHKRPEKIIPGLRSDDGSYTSITVIYKGETIFIQTAAEGGEQYILVSPVQSKENYLVVEAGLLWNRKGSIGRSGDQLTANLGDRTITVFATETPVADAYSVTSVPHLAFSTAKALGISTGKQRSLAEISAVVAKQRRVVEQRIASYGPLSESFQAMQTILAWNATYDAPNERVISPVSRSWSAGWGGFVLFDWDTYFASYMYALFNKELAYANAIEITKAITPDGFIPNYQSPYGQTSFDRSQPPIGSKVIMEIYKKYREKWLLEEVYQELLTWNRWWPKNRDRNVYLCWGSNPVAEGVKTIESHNRQAAAFESGLDNSPMYEDIPFNAETNTMELADVGLMAMYIMDCNSLAAMATELGLKQDAAELKKRAAQYSKKLQGMWDEKSGIYLNQRIDTQEKSYRLSPTNFYPLLAGVCTQAQAARMMKEHYFNPDEFHGEYVIPSIARNDSAFKDNDYWRGRIWGPMNFLTYMGMQQYQLPEARTDLITRSKALLMKNWKKEGGIYENYNAVTGEGGDVGSADAFYHWGALLTFMEFVEKGYMAPKGK